MHFPFFRTWFSTLLLAAAAFPAAAASSPSADVILVNARVFTMNPQQAWADAIAVRGDKILAVGDKTKIETYRGKTTKVIDAEGRLILPGFTDCHIHFMDGSLGLTRVDLNGAGTVAEIQKRVKAYADSHPQEPWIQGMGWTYPTFKPTGLPDKKILDDVVSDRPIYLVAFDGHSSWANSKALAMAGIDRGTPDPPNGKIVRDEQGEATGALKEAAGDLIDPKIPKPTRAERLDALRKGIHEANKAGLVRVHSAGQDFEYLDLYNELRKKGELLLLQGAPGAEEWFGQAFDWARRQGALSLELRSATSLARLHHREGRTTQARKVLAPVYRRFTEGFGTADLVTAKALLDTLR